MNANDFPEFVDAIDLTCRNIRRPAIDDDEVLQGWFAVLSQYGITQVKQALNALVLHPDSKFGITPALIFECMNIKQRRTLGWQDVIRHARKIECPMGVLARMFIKSHELNNNPDHHLKGAALAFLDQLSDLQARADRGEYTEHEMCRMYAHNVKISQTPFMPGFCTPSNTALLKETWSQAMLTHEFKSIKNDKDALLLEARPVSTEDIEKSKLRIRQEMASIQPLQADKDQQVINDCESQAYQMEAVNELVGSE